MIAEALAFSGGSVAGAGLKLVSKVLDSLSANNTAQRDIELKKLELREKGVHSARKFAEHFKAGVWVRRFIAVVVFTYLFVLPAIAAYLKIPFQYAYVEDGYWFWQSEHIKFRELNGFVVLPGHNTIASAIAGFYFGAGIVK